MSRLRSSAKLSALLVFVGCTQPASRHERQALAGVSISAELTPDAPVMTTYDAPISDLHVAFGSGVYFAVWSGPEGKRATVIFGARISASGTLLDPQPVEISSARYSCTQPDLAFDGTNFLVVWVERVQNAYSETHSMAARVTPTGVVLDRPGFALDETLGRDIVAPRVAFNGAEYLVVWQATDATGRAFVQGARVSTGGVSQLTGVISSGPGDRTSPALSSVGTDFLVAWEDQRSGNKDIRAGVVRNGVALNDVAVATTTRSEEAPAVRCLAPNSCIIGWSAPTAGGGAPWVASTFVTASTVAVLQTQLLSDAGTLQGGVSLDLAATDIVAAWDEGNFGLANVKASRVSPSGTVQDPNGVVVAARPAPAFFPSLTWSGSEHLVAWTDTSAVSGVVATRLSPTLTPVGPNPMLVSNRLALTKTDDAQSAPSLAFNGTEALVAWTDARSTWDVLARRLTASGRWVDPAPLLVAGGAGDQDGVSAAWLDDRFVLAWVNYASGNGVTNATWLTRDAGVVGALRVVSGALVDTHEVDVVPGQGETLISFNHYVTGGNGYDVSGARMSPTGVLRDVPPVALASGPGNQLQSAGTFRAAGFELWWSDWTPNQRHPAGLTWGTTRTNTPPAPTGHRPKVALSGIASHRLMVYERNYSIFGVFTDAQSRPGAEFAIAVDAGVCMIPIVASDDLSSLVVWADDSTGEKQLFAKEVWFDGGVGQSFAVTPAGSGSKVDVALVDVGPARYLVAYSNYVSLTASTRVGLRFITLSPLPDGSTCFEGGECASGVCQAEVCTTPVDAGSPDAGTDGGLADGGEDAGPFDGGADAGVFDGGEDAGLFDGGPDAGSFDGGTNPVGPRVLEVGCGCQAGPTAQTWLLMLLLVRAGFRATVSRGPSAPTKVARA